MNNKKLLFFTFFAAVFTLLVGNQQAFSQVITAKESFEEISGHWFYAVDKFESTAGVTKEEFAVFSRFSRKTMDSLRADFTRNINNGTVTVANAKDYEDVLAKALTILYKKFEKIEQLYPSSVNEYRNYHAPMLSQVCDSGCDNINFASGDLSGWYAYYACNNSSSDARDIVNTVGGLAGAVKHAANDTWTSYMNARPYYNTTPNPSPDYQVNITSGSRGDGLVPSIPVVSPFGGSYSVMLGDSTLPNYGVSILSQTFKVSSANANFTYQYAVFLENPQHPTPHTYYQQPFFTVAVLKGPDDTIPFCGEYTVVSQGGEPGFHAIYYPPGGDSVYYKNWTIVNVPLTKYIGQCVTVVFEVGDCSLGGHFGYAYVSASCAPLSIISTSPNFCGQDSITLTGPAGEGEYRWTGPIGGIRGSDTLRQINVDSTGTYTLIVTPYTGATCNDTLTITLGKKLGPPPYPNFTADTGCVGMSTSFLNRSNPIRGANFYWDFYNNGNYEDSTVNPTWRYAQPGVYQVKLQELYNGCGMDTIINVVIDSISNSAFMADTVCYLNTTTFDNISSGGSSYYWNFGDPPAGVNNTSVNVNPTHTFSAPGTYTVSLIAKHHDWCNDTVKEQVIVLPLPVATITGTDSICYGTFDTLKATGGTKYKWSTGATTSSISVNPTAPATYTVTVNNGICSNDTTFTLYIKPKLTGTINASSVCLNDTVHLSATGGGTYLWSNGATTSSISVVASSTSDSTFSVLISNGGKSCLDIDTSITIYPLPSNTACCNDTIYSGNSIVLNGSSGNSYYWLPPTGLSCDTCPDPTASPTVTTTYTLITTTKNGCQASSALTVDVEIPCKDFYVPNVFSPNGDGVNDTYLIKVEFMSAYEITIFNRWGKKIFYSTNPDAPWDGTIDGAKAAAGVYYYLIRATCENGKYFQKDGYLQLIRGK